ncbi:hypothetical protein [Cellulomonas phragmiteti]|uniref:Uncharacterized protein n=1 Tax=Cellulomonas phragmiteti TaxID=478780 RepID=A0ABQ4DR00_9CELL|nr:hypothetical protein [Cellulomonas phragmiteti]GIG41749.1 hypothetical protein Cph01nite_35110 [Cellulomonas phragmiteti]
MRDRARRTRTIAVVVVAALIGTSLLGALAALGGGGRTTVEIPRQGPWTVSVAGDLRRVPACTQDPVVVDGYLSADEPSSGGSLVLAADAQVEDVERVVTCVARGIDPSRITVLTTPQA